MRRRKTVDRESNPYLEREIQITRLRDILVFFPFLAAAVFLSPFIDWVLPERAFLGIPIKFSLFFILWLIPMLVLSWVTRKMRRKLEERDQ